MAFGDGFSSTGVGGGGGGGSGFTGGGAPARGGGPITSQNWSPDQMGKLLQILTQQTQAGTQNLNQFVQNPLSSSLFTGTVNPILQAMQPYLQQQQQTLTDQQRALGNLGDTTSRVAMGNLMGQQATQMGGVVGNLANQVYQNILQGLIAPTTMAQNTVRSVPQYQQNYAVPQGGGAGSGPMLQSSQDRTMSPTPGFDQFTQSLQNTGYSSGTQGPNAGAAAPTTAGPSIWDILNQQSGGGGGNIMFDPSTGTFTNQPSGAMGNTGWQQVGGVSPEFQDQGLLGWGIEVPSGEF